MIATADNSIHFTMNTLNTIALFLLFVLGTSYASVNNNESIRSFQKNGYIETSTPGRIVSLSRRSIAFYSEAAPQENFERGVLVGSAFVRKNKKTSSAHWVPEEAMWNSK